MSHFLIRTPRRFSAGVLPVAKSRDAPDHFRTLAQY
jgi:hypothetical protein